MSHTARRPSVLLTDALLTSPRSVATLYVRCRSLITLHHASENMIVMSIVAARYNPASRAASHEERVARDAKPSVGSSCASSWLLVTQDLGHYRRDLLRMNFTERLRMPELR